tara:strand:+ start:98 stop:334 length:237 start_codon:yes stop_codon:yes gene_type:complete
MLSLLKILRLLFLIGVFGGLSVGCSGVEDDQELFGREKQNFDRFGKEYDYLSRLCKNNSGIKKIYSGKVLFRAESGAL